MSRILGFSFFLLLLAAVAFITLQDMKPIADSSADTPITGTEWKPVSIGGQDVAQDAKLHLRFEVDGKLNGNGGCNSFFGNYTLTDVGIGHWLDWRHAHGLPGTPDGPGNPVLPCPGKKRRGSKPVAID